MELSNKQFAANLDASLVSKLLQSRGWQELDVWNTVLVYRRPQSENSFTEIVLPKDKNDELYADYMENAARRCARFERRTIEDVLKEWGRLEEPQTVARVRLTKTLRTKGRKEKAIV